MTRSIILGLLLAFGYLSQQGNAAEVISNTATVVDTPKINAGAGRSWWDSSKQSVRYPDSEILPLSEDFLKERTDLADAAPKPVATARPATKWGFFSFLDSIFSMTNLVVAIFVVFAVALLAYVIFKNKAFVSFNHNNEKNDGSKRKLRDAAKVIDLPFDVSVDDDNLSQTAQKLAQQGDYQTAIRYLYSHMLVELDEHNWIKLRRGNTNRMYLRQLRPNALIARCFASVMQPFEEVFFGHHQISENTYNTARDNVVEIENLIKQNVSPERIDSRKVVIGKLSGDVSMPSILLCLVIAGLIAQSGCNVQLPKEIYGENSSTNAIESLNGFSVFRSMINDSGRQTFSTPSLSHRLDRCGAIIWTSNGFDVPTARQSAWIQDWLQENTGSTFVIVGRDYEAGKDYWTAAAEQASLRSKSEYLQQAALSQAESDARFLENAKIESQITPWFVQRNVLGSFHQLQLHRGEEDSSKVAENKTDELLIGYQRSTLIPLPAVDREELRNKFKMELLALDEVYDAFLDEKYVDEYEYEYGDEYGEAYDKQWEEDYSQNLPEAIKQANAEIEAITPLDAKLAQIDQLVIKPLLIDEREAAFAFAVNDPDNWPGSELLVINNGSILNNYALANPVNRIEVQRLIERLPKKGRIAFMNAEDPRISFRPDSDLPFGLAMLTIFPLNVIVVHIVVAGILILVVLWPIFGRPQISRPVNERDFGKHVQAFGRILRRTGDRTFANHMIGRYFREQRREPQSPWSQIDETPKSPTIPVGVTLSNPYQTEKK